jgi:hypothetical protein
LLLPALVAPLLGVDLNSIWTMPGLILVPVILLSSPLLALSRQAVTAITAFAVALPLLMLAVAPLVAIAIHRAGPDPVLAHAKLLAAHSEQEWRRNSDRPLRIVGGDFGLANATAFYLPEQASAYPVLEPETAPWVTPARIASEGAVMVCELPDDLRDCGLLIRQAMDRVTAQNLPPRQVEVAITRSYLGIPGRPARYLIIVVPPRP